MALTAVVQIGGSRYRSRRRGCWDRGTWGRLLWRWLRTCKLNKHHKGPAEAVYYCFIAVVSSCMHILIEPYPLHYMEWDFQSSLQFPRPTVISPCRPQSPHAWRKVKMRPKHTQTNRKKREEERKEGNKKPPTYLPSGNVLVTVFFNLHTQLGTRIFSSGRLFNCVANRNATYTNTHIIKYIHVRLRKKKIQQIYLSPGAWLSSEMQTSLLYNPRYYPCWI